MAQPTKSGLSVEDLKKSLKTLSSEMNPEQLKRANETLEKLESVSAKTNDENVEIQKTNTKIEKSLDETGPINKSLLELQKLYRNAHKENIKNNKLSLAKLDKLATGRQQDIKRVLPIREDNPLTFREGAKATVASVKGAISGIGSGIKSIGSGIRDVFTKPGEVLSKAKGKVQGAIETGTEFVKDVATTKKDYDIRRDRVSERMVESELGQGNDGSLMDPKDRKRLRKNVAEVSYDKMAGAETKLLDINKKLKQFEDTGVPPPKELVKQKEEQEKIHREADIRPKDAPVSKKQKAAPATAEGPSEKANEAAEKSAIESLTKARSENPEADNITSASEKMADSLKELSQTSKELLETTKQQLDTFKEIQKVFGTEKEKVDPKKKYAPLLEKIDELKKIFEEKDFGAAAPAGGGSLIDSALDIGGDLLDRGKGKGAGKGFPRGKAPSISGKGIGGRMSSAKGLFKGGGNLIKSAVSGGSNLIKGAVGGITAGGAVAAATTVAGGLALNYGLTKGADAITEAAGADTNITPEMEAQDQANFEKASFFEKAQSGVARGIEGVGSFLGADKTVAAAKVARIKSETEYLKTKEAKAAPSETASGKKTKGEEGSESDKKLIDQFVKAYPPSKGFTFEAMGEGLTIYKDGEKFRNIGKSFSKQLKTMDAATFAGLAMSSEGATAKAGSEAKPQGLTKEQADQIPEKDLFGGLTKEQYQLATQKEGGKYKTEMIDESGKEITDEKKRVEAMKKGVGQLQDLTDAAGPKDVTAKMDSSQVGAMQPAAAEGKLSSDPQMDQDIKAHRKRAAEVTPSRPSAASSDLSTSSLEYTDLDRERSQAKPAPAPLIMNNSSNNSTTKVMPMKAEPRPGDRGSAYERYLERTSAY